MEYGGKWRGMGNGRGLEMWRKRKERVEVRRRVRKEGKGEN